MADKNNVKNKKTTNSKKYIKASVNSKKRQNTKVKKIVKPSTNLNNKQNAKIREIPKTNIPPMNRKAIKNKAVIKRRRVFKIKKVMILLIIIFLIVFVFIKITNKPERPKTDDVIYNNHKSFIKEQKKDGIVFKNIKCTYDGKDSMITYTIKNVTNKKIELSKYNVIIKDKSKNIITKIVANVKQEIAPKKEVTMANSVVGVDLSDAYYMELEIKTKNK